ncbi:1,4-beta-D-glucan cellobiohydrolase CEL6A [Colletotrichum fructicola]|uniref:Glucanase n=1 Tax=Colletotrichum fructicola (strain Nara gc5) TaxID=1213859 RepID=L2FVL3_COLFN|nr:1,4-beta-D-glucan cellobiohydrolase [Colletotrichum fructicola]KAF4478785.1 1,4-beta-D-glucan cellobiohydrolase CEL6A [Colletotrichum fructicola Nara gc5]KAE9575097.1 1,4-beta-D-glucan cellobiohydrolase [Colletotrichum fructicola]KAF4422595.1 1,4-beta-D-glucan cellobiohydrolase CEL6A [Colletotrichum fructicola]KAF4893868.1 1,4-beta-D-glucan cellobiohydrolase CEL6A [Colletotrichum fructicola]KAF4910644.1 1,4-beta-D-glucan cellobiohydrolase CEL6A [Colletotrichum fructicola]
MLAHFLLAAALAPAALAGPVKARQVASYDGNPLADRQLFPNPYYADEIKNLAIPKMTGDLATKAAKVAEVPSFAWLDTREKISLMNSTLAEIRKLNQGGANPPYAGTYVVYNFPDRDCSAKASAGELAIADGGLDKYKTEYIDRIAALAKEYSDTRIVFVYEPDGLANLITNMGVQKCSQAADTYKAATDYAFKTLNLDNVAIYVDAGHAGWLGWEANLQPTATLYADVYKKAGSPKAVRGLVTNVSNFNGWNLTSAPSYTTPNNNYDESKFHAALTPMLKTAGYPANYLVDQGRSGKQPTGQQIWGDWCNVKDAGFGARPKVKTGIDTLDAIVWVKPGGESDGTSNSSATRYDEKCSSGSSFTPAPEAGTWFQEYFEMLIKNADPAF